jgi:hypothetical protein
MEIYEIDENEAIKKTNSDGGFSIIPLDPANKDYQEYLSSLEPTQPEEE